MSVPQEQTGGSWWRSVGLGSGSLTEARLKEEAPAAAACGASAAEAAAVAGLSQVERAVLEDRVKAHARASCGETMRAYYDCCKAHPVALVVSCRGALADLNACLGQYTTPEAMFQEKLEHVRAGRAGLPADHPDAIRRGDSPVRPHSHHAPGQERKQ